MMDAEQEKMQRALAALAANRSEGSTMILNNVQPKKDRFFVRAKKWLEVKNLERRYGLVSGSMQSGGLACYIASARPRLNATQYKIEGGIVGEDDLSARLSALKLWVRKHGQSKEFLGNDKSAFAFVKIDNNVRHAFMFGQTRYGMGQEPAEGHKPVTIIEVEDTGLYMYDERRYGGVPSKESAQEILSNLESGMAILHPISEPGCIDRLKDIIAGRAVDPAHWPQR